MGSDIFLTTRNSLLRKSVTAIHCPKMMHEVTLSGHSTGEK
jgi:hypothetical protein